MQEIKERVESFDNTALFVRFNIPDTGAEGAKGIVLLNHGYADHSGRYAHAVKVLCDNNLIVISFDLRGNGHSGPSLGYCESFQDILLDNVFLMNLAQERFGKKIVGLVGHSFGGLIITYTAALLGRKSPPIFLSSPSYKFRKEIHRWQLLILKYSSKIFPKFMIPSGVIAQYRSNNPENNNTQHTDPLIFKKVAMCFAYFFINLVSKSEQTRKVIRTIKTRITVFVGQDDSLCSTSVTRAFCREFDRDQLRFHIVENGGHEIFNENNGSQIVALHGLKQWSDSLFPISKPLTQAV